MRIIGVTGPTGSGKGELCRRLAAYGYLHLDTDRIYHRLLKEDRALKGELAAAFGGDILENGEVSRKALGEKVFGRENRKNLTRLNKIAHRCVCGEVEKEIEAAKATGCPGVLIDAPLLFTARLDRICDAVVYVDADKDVRLARILARDGITEENARRRIRAGQVLTASRRARCTHFIENNGGADLDDMAARLAAALRGGGGVCDD